MARPISFNLQRVYPRLMEPWVTCGDSITALNASTPSALFGIAGAWPFLTWIGFSGRLAAVEKQVNEQAEDRRVIKQMTVGGVVTAILIAIGGVVYSSLKSGGGR